MVPEAGAGPDPSRPVEPRPGLVLPVDKPSGPTSHDMVSRARRLLDTGRIGHTGTLDPFASGLLLLCVDAATRLSEYLVGLDKTYEATVRLGLRTDTLDPGGSVVAEDEAWKELSVSDLRALLESFVGEIEQRPPRFSAKKVGGERAYRKARRGEPVELEPEVVRIHDLELLEADLPELRIRMACSSGTYVRALARDLGERAGSSAHLVRLRRTRIGRFDVEDAVVLDDGVEPARLRAAGISPAGAMRHLLPVVRVDAGAARRLAHGQPVEVADPSARPAGDGAVAVVAGDVLVAVGEGKGARIQPRKVFVRA